MSEPEVDDPFSFLEQEPGIDDATPGQKDLWAGGLFLSHSGQDFDIILERIVSPVVEPRFYGDGCFVHNRGSGGAWIYRKLVRLALHLCDKFLVAVSARSAQNAWVRAEVAWALRRNRPIVIVLLDKTQPEELSAELVPGLSLNSSRIVTVDFHNDPNAGQELATALDQLLERFPYPRRLRIRGLR